MTVTDLTSVAAPALLWSGAVVANSLLATVKFRTPSLRGKRHVILDVGATQFGVFVKLESALCLATWVALAFATPPVTTETQMALGVATAAHVIQALVLAPAMLLDAEDIISRAHAMGDGKSTDGVHAPASAGKHFLYIGGELVKIVSLVASVALL